MVSYLRSISSQLSSPPRPSARNLLAVTLWIINVALLLISQTRSPFARLDEPICHNEHIEIKQWMVQQDCTRDISGGLFGPYDPFMRVTANILFFLSILLTGIGYYIAHTSNLALPRFIGCWYLLAIGTQVCILNDVDKVSSDNPMYDFHTWIFAGIGTIHVTMDMVIISHAFLYSAQNTIQSWKKFLYSWSKETLLIAVFLIFTNNIFWYLLVEKDVETFSNIYAVPLYFASIAVHTLYPAAFYCSMHSNDPNNDSIVGYNFWLFMVQVCHFAYDVIYGFVPDNSLMQWKRAGFSIFHVLGAIFYVIYCSDMQYQRNQRNDQAQQRNVLSFAPERILHAIGEIWDLGANLFHPNANEESHHPGHEYEKLFFIIFLGCGTLLLTFTNPDEQEDYSDPIRFAGCAVVIAATAKFNHYSKQHRS